MSRGDDALMLRQVSKRQEKKSSASRDDPIGKADRQRNWNLSASHAPVVNTMPGVPSAHPARAEPVCPPGTKPTCIMKRAGSAQKRRSVGSGAVSERADRSSSCGPVIDMLRSACVVGCGLEGFAEGQEVARSKGKEARLSCLCKKGDRCGDQRTATLDISFC